MEKRQYIRARVRAREKQWEKQRDKDRDKGRVRVSTRDKAKRQMTKLNKHASALSPTTALLGFM